MLIALGRTRGIARGGAQQIIDRGQRVSQYIPWRLGGVDAANPLGLLLREVLVGGGDRCKEAFALELQPVGLQRPLCLARAPNRRFDDQQQGAVWRQATGGELVDRCYLRHPQLASGALVGKRGDRKSTRLNSSHLG